MNRETPVLPPSPPPLTTFNYSQPEWKTKLENCFIFVLLAATRAMRAARRAQLELELAMAAVYRPLRAPNADIRSRVSACRVRRPLVLLARPLTSTVSTKTK